MPSAIRFMQCIHAEPMKSQTPSSKPNDMQGHLLKVAAVCSVAIAHWLAWAYALEFMGWSVFLQVWAAGLGVMLAKSWLLACLMRVPHAYDSTGFPCQRACKGKIS